MQSELSMCLLLTIPLTSMLIGQCRVHALHPVQASGFAVSRREGQANIARSFLPRIMKGAIQQTV